MHDSHSAVHTSYGTTSLMTNFIQVGPVPPGVCISSGSAVNVSHILPCIFSDSGVWNKLYMHDL